MNNHQQQVQSTNRRIISWAPEHPDITSIILVGSSSTPARTIALAPSTTPATPIAEQLLLLEKSVNDAEAAASEFEGINRSVLGLGAEIITLRTDLVSHQMVHVATIARTAIPDVVRMTEALRTPRVTRKTEVLLSSAEAMAKAGEQYQAQLVAAGLAADFPAQLRGAAASLKSAIDSRGALVATRTGEARKFQEAIVRGRKAVDTVTVLIKRQFKGDASVIDQWMQLRRVPKSGVKQAVASAPAATPATVPASSPAQTASTAAATAPQHQSAAA
ncbi:MAG: hypothetical protein ACHQQ3_07335 [Gemmatimonadales bacterium]